ncbi:hypothetical protein DA096_23240 [Vibrio rotiferianus]|uniref:Uncharacterized protein n=1 Tax=Vibrio rotiferianus TaxID=190895 RepID=A0A7Y3ZE70_9VIBR|nr:hypothetical protein BSZ04_08600 [Vibrio rotiferianus]NOH50985.1 hypothetical protein [Vibrio rotiferianus]NOH68555.1 hypothetical protein [Vibrio rotiferianus]TMX31423.1 hypothetical protein DA095_25485 [Vibrio rotiferianus]TMX42976.1 hypothetical protein DA093_22860 [Vibrio rotiferianus]
MNSLVNELECFLYSKVKVLLFFVAVFPNRISRLSRSELQVKLIIFRILIKLFDKFLKAGKMNLIAY